MPNTHLAAMTLSAAALLLTAGCGTRGDNCYLNGLCAGGGSGGSSGTGGHVNCDPMTGAVDVSCGVFVNGSAAPGGNGKQATPFQSFAEAAAAKPARVFACAGMYTETMPVSFTGGVEVYGGFTGCTATGWAWSASAQAQITTAANVPGVVLNMDFALPDARSAR